MKFLRELHDKFEPLFHKGGKLEKLYPMYEAHDTLLFTPGQVTRGASHVRDTLDLKRLMVTVVFALIPCILVAMYNTGYQANIALADGASAESWRGWVMDVLGFGYSATNPLACVFHGALYYLPVLLVTFIVGGHIEVAFAIIRRHEVNEGFLVTGMLFPLILPPTIPLWQVALGISFGVILGKEVFGGTGMNIFNPALMARAFLFFAYPAQISGDKVWTAVTEANQIDGYSGATALGRIAGSLDPSAPDAWRSALDGMGVSWLDAFLGTIPGSMGETSALACLLGAALLILTGIGSWRIMAGGVIGSLAITLLLNAVGSETNALMNVPFHWQVVLGGWAFGLVFMATDPVSAPYTDRGRFIYGIFIGIFAILIRVVNPAYPEGMMLAILFMNMFSPLLDWMAKRSNIKRRLARYAAV
ncbi:MAG: NADH:ubiquinone reductase (Na(+)-transporting) subunit B [Candidatus Hydrogenedentes bacterium]|nr:NADH:ubiquinone reductase (Na(+)-transporting) subunit B [Candidatus Hydrogenedentota bacterium]